MKTALSIAGSDCSAGAGVQADLKTFAAHGVFGTSCITSVVAENTSRVIGYEDISPDIIRKQIDAVYEDIPPDAVKIGMLSRRETMLAVATRLKEGKTVDIVVDPVMYAKNGDVLMDPAAVSILMTAIIPLAKVLTPNIPEAERLSQLKIETEEDMREAAKRIHALGCGAVIVKGGHGAGAVTDILYDGTTFYSYSRARIATKNTHGTGCTYSSAIAANLALGTSLPEATGLAKKYVTTAIRHGLNLGQGNGPTHHFYDLYRHASPRQKPRTS